MRRLVHLRHLHGVRRGGLAGTRGRTYTRRGGSARLRLRRQAELPPVLPNQGDGRARWPDRAHAGLSGTLRSASARQGDLARLNALDAGLLHAFPGGGERALGVDAATGVLYHRGGKSKLARIHRRPGNAKVGGKTHDVDRLDAALVEIAIEPRLRSAVGFHERRIAVDVVIEALADDQLGVRDIDVLVDGGTVRALHAVIRPQDLVAVGELHAFERLLAGMGGGKRDVPRG